MGHLICHLSSMLWFFFFSHGFWASSLGMLRVSNTNELTSAQQGRLSDYNPLTVPVTIGQSRY